MDLKQRLRIYLGLEKQKAPDGYRFPEGPWGGSPICEQCGASVRPSAIEQHDRWHAEHVSH